MKKKIHLSVFALWLCLSPVFLIVKKANSQDVTAAISYDQVTGPTIQQGAFGLNLFQGFDPDQSGTPGNQAYKDAMNFMNPSIVRYHSWEMLGQSTNRNGWLNANNEWDAAKINNALNGAPNYPIVLMNIPGWPSAWQDGEGRLLPEHYQDYVNWCVSLLTIINIDQNRGIKYWEITNERDDIYKENSDELGRIFLQVATAMKAVDPTIKTGGAAFARPDLLNQVGAFFSTAEPQLDFVSYHSYANGTPNSPTQQVYDRAIVGGLFSAEIRREFAKYSSREIEYFHDEYNISWAPPDPHQSTYVSMIFDAIFTLTAAKSGATGTMAWNESDGWYGKMDNSYNLRPSAYLFHNFNANLIGGIICNSSVSDTSSLVVLATQKGTLRQLVVINRSDKDQRYKFTFTGLPSEVNNSTLFTSSENKPEGAIEVKDISYGQLTGTAGAFFAKNTVSILSIDVNNLRSTGDLTSPSAPTALAAQSTDRSLTLTWTASTDNVGVASYDIYVNDVLAGTIDGATTQFTSTWLEPFTTYTLGVVAKDATGNESERTTLTATTEVYSPNPVPSVFTNTSWQNQFSGNVINDSGQSTTAAGSVALAQDQELRITLNNTSQYSNVFQSSFDTPIDLSVNSQLSVDIKSDVVIALRVKLFDVNGNSMDLWQNTFYVSDSNQKQTFTLNFADYGFGNVDKSSIKGLLLMSTNETPRTGTLYIDNLELGQPGAYTSLRNAERFINTTSGLDYRYYEGAWELLPDFSTLTPTETGTVTNFDLSVRNRDDNFSFEYIGYVTVPADGMYTFYTSSDDGSKLYIGDTEVVNNDGLHGMEEKSGTIGLRAGKHRLRVTYLEAGGGEGLEVRYAGPEVPKQLIPNTALFRATDEFIPNPQPSQFTPTSWKNTFSGNVINDDGQTTTNSGNTQVAQDEELRIVLNGVNQYTPFYQSTFTNTIDVSPNSEFKVDITSNVDISIRVKLLDVAGNTMDMWQNTLYVSGNGAKKTHTLNFASNGFGSVNANQIKGIIFMYPDQTVLNGEIYLDNLELGKPLATTTNRDADSVETVAGVEYEFYEGAWTTLPDFSTLTSTSTGVAPNFTPFPTTKTDEFGLRYTGYITVPADGIYTFFTTSDDGSKFYVGDTEVVNNDGAHGMVEKAGSIGLKSGKHKFTLTYFEAAGGEGLEVRYAGPNLAKQIIPDSVLSRENRVTITSVSPTAGLPGSFVTIKGTSFTNTTAVSFNGTNAATFTVDSATQITVVVPVGATSGPITVATTDGAVTSAQSFTVETNYPKPVVTSFSPTSGPVGTRVTVTGAGFYEGVTTVKFNGVNAASVRVLTSSSLAAIVPEGASKGKITIETPGGKATSKTNYTVTKKGSPVVYSFTPDEGTSGTLVTISGANLADVKSVRFSTRKAETFTIIDANTIAVVVPERATSGKIRIRTDEGRTVSASSFNIITEQGRMGNIDSEEALLTLHVSPNPFAGEVTIHAKGLASAKLYLTILDSQGRVVRELKEVEAFQPISLNNLPNGLYYLRIRHGKKLQTLKALKIN